ncbi:MAG: arginine--tRNA ligase [Bacilli bacterium]|nr:arginine--tRNA ligase [Bacilli bacterium]
MSIKNTLKEIILNKINYYKLNLTINEINIHEDIENNYFKSDIAISLSNILKEKPSTIAETIKNKIINSNIIETITTNSNGIINIYIKEDYLLNYINDIIEKNNKYGYNNTGHNKKINIKYKNPNINNQIDLKELRKIIYCDNISRIMQFCSYDITKDYYIDNNINESDINKIKKELDKYRIYFDNFTKEESICNQKVEKLLTEIRYNKYCYIENDCLWLKTTSFGDDKDRLIIDENGEYTPLVINLAYIINLIDNNYQLIIDFVNKNNIEEVNMYIAALSAIEKNYKILNYKKEGNINIKNNNNIEELSKQIGINMLRYFYSIYNIKDNINIDVSLLLQNEQDNPYIYIENTNILLASILNEKNTNITNNKYKNSKLFNQLLLKTSLFEDTVIKSCIRQNPYIIAEYAYELSTIFNNYYEEEIKKSKEENLTNEIIYLFSATKISLNNSLDLIGIIPREEK